MPEAILTVKRYLHCGLSERIFEHGWEVRRDMVTMSCKFSTEKLSFINLLERAFQRLANCETVIVRNCCLLECIIIQQFIEVFQIILIAIYFQIFRCCRLGVKYNVV